MGKIALIPIQFLPVAFAFLSGMATLHGQEDNTLPVPAPKPAPIEFNVLSSKTTRMEVKEAQEMPDLPPITGTVNVTVQIVEDPNLPEPPSPILNLPAADPADAARLAELRKLQRNTRFVSVSATIYDHSRTFLRISPHGRTGESVTAWSNLDFNYFGGFSTYRVKDAEDGNVHDFSLLMSMSNIDTRHWSELAQKKDIGYKAREIPKIPDLAVGGPSFILVEGNANSAAMDTLEQIHELYRKEGARMEEAYRARVIARAERKAYLLANPRKPEDIVIKFWESDPLKNK